MRLSPLPQELRHGKRRPHQQVFRQSCQRFDCDCGHEGPYCSWTGLLESAYEVCLTHELRKQGLRAESQVLLPVVYDGVTIDLGYRMDLVVEDLVVVELKCVEEVTRVHHAQLLSYLKLSHKNVGLLINFHVAHLRDGIKRLVNGRNWDQ